MLSERQLFLRHLAQTNDIPLALEIERAEGCYLYDYYGKKYLDLIAGISVSALGHRHAKVLEALQQQTDRYLHLMVYGEYIQTPQVQYARLLTQLLPPSLNCVYFTNSGTEAAEGAMKLAKRVTGRSEFVSFHDAYHGSTQGALSLAGGEWLKTAYRPLLPGVRQLHYNNLNELKSITSRTAAVFVEPVQAEAGARQPDEGFLQALRDRCNETGALLVFDEIQTGFGRCGSLWQTGAVGFAPDILLLGKALGGGLPLGAFIADINLMQQLSHNPVLGHITTFGGHPLSCAAGLATLQEIVDGNWVSQVASKATLFREKLQHPRIKALHGKGLLLALELNSFTEVQQLVSHCVTEGVLTDWFLFNDRCVRIAPPLIISEKEIDTACDILLAGVEKL